MIKPDPKSIPAQTSTPADSPSLVRATEVKSAPLAGNPSSGPVAVRILSACWLAGCLWFGMKLLATAIVLRRRLAACRPVTEPTILQLLECARAQIGLKRTPALFVTPDAISPCIVGTWHPRIILPESIVTEASGAALSHVLAHELAHLVRGDLWTNWLLLAARIPHWFNPMAWWTVREMQADREAACDELALAALGQADRKAYAATIVDLAANLISSAIAPGMIGLFSSTGRLQSRVERLVRSPAVTVIWSPIAAGLLVLIALVGLTDAMPGDAAEPAASKTAPATDPKAPGTAAQAKAAPAPVKGGE
ncbi:MAG TPA: M56 family metallopeptidase, partial [Planctomycetaceae bacterium]